ncbi:IclR family transcriptional regulator [Bradyrhizobium nitroreducens]|uniref:IclR family transcriptional regulator n=1 Tax=Bradyrhizobium nitroreducens TaxID=709803 RepID=A0A2M6UNJ5_9BRAD|nr:IclR family transcriptional regulator [Bradyrhizobium nitroreducens]PIT06085.1 IclR family transcriptional regulator [Bradyrhizobium nitroreducens]
MAKRATGRKQATRSDDREDKLYVKSVGKAFRILEGFADSANGLSLSELAEAADLDKSATQRLVHTMVKLGYLERTSLGHRPGRRLLQRSFDYLRGHPLITHSLPILAELRRDAQERIDLSLFDDVAMLYLVRLQSKRDSLYGYLSGRSVPTFCTSGGRAVLSQLPLEQVKDILNRSDLVKVTPKTAIAKEQILARVQEARDAGYAVVVEEMMVGEIACGVAILDDAGKPIGAVHVAGSLAEWSPFDFEKRFAPLAVQAARAISAV